MGALPEYENPDNTQGVMPEYTSKFTQMYQYQNKSVDKFTRDFGAKVSQRQFANNAAAVAAGLKPGDWYCTASGGDLIVKIVQ